MQFQPRQFPRVSLATEVTVRCHDESIFTATGVEIGAGGMALESANRLGVAQPIQVSFSLRPGRPLTLQAVVWWKRGNLVGVRFDPADTNRQHVQQWVEEQKKLD